MKHPRFRYRRLARFLTAHKQALGNMDRQNIYDFLVIGTGAGGSACAFRLAQSGRSVLLMEKGDDLPMDGSTYDPRRVVTGEFNSKEPWHDRDGKIFRPEEHFNVGGKTRWYGAALLRPDPQDFAGDERHSLPGWPCDYGTMLPYYEQAEKLLDIHVFPPEVDLKRMVPAIESEGWKTRPATLGLSPAIHNDPEQEIHWDGYALPDPWKCEARFHLLGHILKLPNVTLLRNAEVERLLPGADSLEIAGVRCKDGREFYATTVLLGAGALHSPRILQRYINANELDKRLPGVRQVGRNFKRHILTAVIGFGWRRKQDRICKTLFWTNERFPHSSVQPLGGWSDVEEVRQRLRWLPGPIRDMVALRSYGFFLQTEDASIPENRVIDEGKGKLPVLDYSVDRMPALRDEHGAMVSHFRKALLKAGLISFKESIPLSGLAHCAGTLAAGNDPHNSVVDEKGRVHGMRNLYVVDGSVIPRLSKMNPALTIYAWALRVADLILEEQIRHEAGTARP
jgi:choline dehydrogenase-like flavoprotein